MNIFTFDTVLKTPGLDLPVRSTLVRDQNRSVLISPIRFSDQQVAEIKNLGPVTDIVAPCLYHHLFVKKALKLFPTARVWGAPGFDKKRPDIPWTGFIKSSNWAHQDVLEALPIEGVPALNEVVFFHPSTRTLITSDLCFNMHKPTGWAAGVILRLIGTYNGFAISRLLKLILKNKPAFEASLQKLFLWNFDKVIMSHGAIVENNGKAYLREALQKKGFSISE